jgi:hypothetical protein
MLEIASGHPAIDRYLANGYERVPGMSSRFAAAICGHLIQRQTAIGIAGDVVEIGTFEGRFFIALALGLAPGEHALGIDVFEWPDIGVLDRFQANCDRQQLSRSRCTAWKTDSGSIAVSDLRSHLAGRAARFVHIDGDHSPAGLRHDLDLAHAVLEPRGVVCVDDMLHPRYPTLVTAALDYLERHREMRVMCIIDRQDIVAATKFLICRAEFVSLYEKDLTRTFNGCRFAQRGEMGDYATLVLTPAYR